ncbi:MAG: precorrin-2 C(20)-methyltransferase [Synechococcaceae cyanobacterium SM2_3_60]|nr:precorrin-2 C(20)-methyltransferase [Synechococcaceae cyanobacterium SM2_3_60]
MATLWGISTGPGDPEWLTLKAHRVLQQVPIIACPQNRQGQAGMAFAIASQYLRPTATLVPLYLPFTQDAAVLQTAWDNAGQQLMPYLAQGQDVAFIAEGDVSLYSTFTYIALSVRALFPDITITPIPGVCSPLAAAALAAQPLSLGSEKITILPALYHVSELEQALAWAEVVVLMKVGSVFNRVWPLLAAQGLLQQSSLVEWIGWPQQQVYTNLSDLSGYHPPYFSVLIIRQTASTYQAV